MKTIFPVLLILFTASFLYSQDHKITLWPDGVPGSINDPEYRVETENRADGNIVLRKVTDPVIEVFLPPEEKASGTAIIICPGGGYGLVSLKHEGWDPARVLNEHGITGIVLSYRLPHDAIMEDKSIGPLQDVQEAIRTTRRRSSEWNIDPDRIGIMGFSAGGHLAATASTLFNQEVYDHDSNSARPDFSILVYPVISMKEEVTHRGSRNNLLGVDPSFEEVMLYSNETMADSLTPPAILFHSVDDQAVPYQNSLLYMTALEENNIPVELHLYERGGHGYGLGRGDGTESSWTPSCIRWLEKRGILE